MLKIWMVNITMICLSQVCAAEVIGQGVFVDSIKSRVVIENTHPGYPVDVRIQFLNYNFSNYHANSGFVLDYFEEGVSRIKNDDVVLVSMSFSGTVIGNQIIKLPKIECHDTAKQEVYSLVCSMNLRADEFQTRISYELQEDTFSNNISNKF